MSDTDAPVVRQDPADLDALGGACTFLARVLLSPPDEELLANLAGGDLSNDWPLPGPGTADALTAMAVEAATAVADGERAEELRQDHRQLFVGPDRLGACPYESVYRSEERLVFEAATMEVRAHYARFGVQAPRLNREPDDHLGLECSFLAHVCVLGLDAHEAGDAAAYERSADEVVAFARQHLLVWTPAFIDELATHARTGFYRAVAVLVGSLVNRLARLSA